MSAKVDEAVRGSGFEDSVETRHLADRMKSYMLSSKSDNTDKKYYFAYQKWKQFIVEKGQPDMLANPVHIALYLTKLLDSGSSYHVVSCSKYAIRWAHSLCGYSDVTDHVFVNNIVEAAKRNAKPRVVKKDPINAKDLVLLCEMYADSDDLSIIRDLTMILLGFSGFLRYDELVSIRCKDISFENEFLKLYIAKSKTDQYRDGNEILIAKGETVACPVEMLKKYVNLAEIQNDSEHFLFKPMFGTKEKTKLIYKNKKMSYTRTRECLVNRLNEVVVGKNLGLHSLRSGGASSASNSDVNERCWKRHGRWRSESAKDGYVEDSIEKRLAVSKQLGL